MGEIDYAAEVLGPEATPGTPPEVDYASTVMAEAASTPASTVIPGTQVQGLQKVPMLKPMELALAMGKAISTGDPTELDTTFNSMLDESNAILLKTAKGFSEPVEGGAQVSLDVLAKATGSESLKDMANAFSSMTAKEHKQFEEAFNAQYGDKFKYKAAEIGGAIAPFIIMSRLGGSGVASSVMNKLKGAVGPGKATLIGGGVSGAVGGAGAAAVNFQEEPDLDQRLKNDVMNAGIGAMIGTPAGALFAAIPAMFNAFKGTLESTFDAPRMDKIMRDARDIGITSMRLSDVTGSDMALGLERAATMGSAGKKKLEEVTEQGRKQILGFFGKTIKALQNTNKNGGALPARLEKAYDKAEDTLVAARDSNAKKGFADAEDAILKQWDDHVASLEPGQRVEELAKATRSGFMERLKTRRVIPGDNLVSTFDELEQRFAATLPSGERDRVIRDIQKLRTRFMDERQGSYSPRELQASLHEYGLKAKSRAQSTAMGYSPETKRIIDTKIFGALKKDLDAAAERTDLPGAAALKAARDRYKDDSMPIDRLRQAGLENLFRDKSGNSINVSPEVLRDKLLAMPTTQFKQAFKMIERYDPELRTKLAGDWLESAFKNAQKLTKSEIEAGKFPIAPGEFMKLVDDKAKFSFIFPPKQRQKIMAAVNTLTKTSLVADKSSRPLVPLIAQAARVAYSRDPTFASGLAAQLLAPKGLAKLVRSDEGLKALSVLSTPFDMAVWAPAVATMGRIIMSDSVSAEVGEINEQMGSFAGP